MANLQDIDIFAGENRTQTLYARNYLNIPVNLTGKTITWLVGRPPNNPGILTAVFTLSGTILSAAAGSFTVPIGPGQTQNLIAGNYMHQGQTLDTSGNIEVVVQGTFRLRALLGQLLLES